jgi:hypothetical protein
MAGVTRGFSASQLAAVKKAPSASELPFECPHNYKGFSQCFAGVVFYDIPANATRPVNRSTILFSQILDLFTSMLWATTATSRTGCCRFSGP